jgi:chemotaxis protein methyltransferase CheR
MADGSRHGSPLHGYSSELFAMPEAPYVLLRDLIVERTGVLFDAPKRGLLADKLSALVAANGLTSFLDYYYLLRYDDPAGAHLAALMNRLAVPETFFWRQPDQFEALARVVAPRHFAAAPTRPLRIWSAASCTGEEPVSIAIALSEAGLLGTQPIEIVATDGSSAMIERARRGLYGDRSFRQLQPRLKEKYFTRDGDSWRPTDQVHRGITWRVANLAREAEIEQFASADVIFCRNVFIYFSDDAIRNTVGVFARCMPRDGHLFVGASESLTRLNVDLELVEIGNAFAYVKPEQASALQRGRPSSDPAITRTAAP